MGTGGQRKLLKSKHALTFGLNFFYVLSSIYKDQMNEYCDKKHCHGRSLNSIMAFACSGDPLLLLPRYPWLSLTIVHFFSGRICVFRNFTYMEQEAAEKLRREKKLYVATL